MLKRAMAFSQAGHGGNLVSWQLTKLTWWEKGGRTLGRGPAERLGSAGLAVGWQGPGRAMGGAIAEMDPGSWSAKGFSSKQWG